MDPILLLFIVIVAVVLVTSLLKLPWLSDKVKMALATGVSVIGAAVHVWFTGDFDVADLTATALQVLGGSQLLYKFVLSHSGLDAKLSNVGVKNNYDADTDTTT